MTVPNAHLPTRTARGEKSLPPGQRRIDGFPRFGTHLQRPPPAVPQDPVIEIRGAVTTPVVVPVADLSRLPRQRITADFHCVAGWSATDLQWEGVPFETLYRMVVEPLVRPGARITHIVFGGLDGYQAAMAIQDATAPDVLIADRLDGRPLDAAHGAPARFVSPNQYGYMNTKHLCVIEVLTAEPTRPLGAAHPVSKVVLRGPLIKRHPRARVWEEERHPYIPARFLRRFYRLFIPPGVTLGARAGRKTKIR